MAACPLPTEANKFIESFFDKDTLHYVTAYLNTEREFRNADFDANTNSLITKNDNTKSIRVLVKEATFFNDAVELVGTSLSDALSRIKNPISEDFDIDYDLVVSSEGPPFEKIDNTYHINVLAHDSLDAIEQTLLEVAFLETVENLPQEEKDKLQELLNTINEDFPINIDTFWNDLFKNDIFRQRIKNANDGKFWKSLKNWTSRRLGTRSGPALEQFLSDKQDAETRYDIKEDEKKKDELYGEIQRSLRNRLASLNKIIEKSEHISNLTSKVRKQYRDVVDAINNEADNIIIDKFISSTQISLNALVKNHKQRLSDNTVSPESLIIMIEHAESMETPVDLAIKQVENSQIQNKEDIILRLEKAKRDIRYIKEEHDRIFPKMLARMIVTEDLDMEVEQRYINDIRTEFGPYSRLTKKGRENRAKYTTEEDYQKALQTEINTFLEENKDKIKQEKLDMLEKRFRKNLYGDISTLRGMLYAAQDSGDKLLALVKIMMDRAKHFANKKTIDFRESITPKYEKFYEARIAELGKEPNTIEELYDPLLEKDDNGENTGHIISDLNYGQYERNHAEFIESIANEHDPEKRKELEKEWYNQNNEREFTDDWYDLMQPLFDRGKSEKQEILEKKRYRFLSKFKDENGEIDYSEMTPEDLDVLRDLNQKIHREKYEADKSVRDLFDSKEGIAKIVETEEFKKEKKRVKEEYPESEYRAWLRSQKYEYIDSWGNTRIELMPHNTRVVPKLKEHYNSNYERDGLPKKSKYENKEYANLKPEHKEFLNAIMKQREINDSGRLEGDKLYTQLPAIRKTKRERYLSEGVSSIKESIREGFQLNLDDIDYGSQVMEEDASGNIRRIVPIFYTQRVSKAPLDGEMDVKDLSFDLMRGIVLDTHNSELHKARVALRATVENSRRVLDRQEIAQRTSRGGRLIGIGKGDTKTIQGEDSQLAKVLSDTIERDLYGVTRIKDEKFLGMGPETWDGILNYTSLNFLAMNFKAAGANLFTSQTMANLESLSGGLIGRGRLKEAHNMYLSDIMNIIGDVGAIKYASRTNIISEFYNATNDFTAEEFRYDYGKPGAVKGKAKQYMLTGDANFALTSMPEHYVQNMAMYAILADIPVTNKKGEYLNESGEVVERPEISLLDVIRTETGKTEFPEWATHVNFRGLNYPLNENTHFLIANQIQETNKFLHGAYATQNRGLIYRTIWGRILMRMHGWLFPQWHKRWGGASKAFNAARRGEQYELDYNDSVRSLFEGHYATTVHFYTSVVKSFAQRKPDIFGRLDTYSPEQLANLKKSHAELAIVFAGLTIFSLLKDLADEDDNEIRQNITYYLAYIMRRSSSEYFFYVNPLEMTRLIKDPAVVFSMAETVYDLGVHALPWNITDTYETTWREGRLKISKPLGELLPYYRHFENLLYLEDSFAYYNN